MIVPRMDRSRPRELVVVAFVSTILLLPTLTYGLGFDHGFMQYIGRGMLHGLWPYVDTFDTSFPAVYVLHMVVVAIGGESALALRVADLFIQVGTALLLFKLARRIYGPRAGLFAAALYAIAYTAGTYYHTAQRDGYLTPCLLGCLWGVWSYLDHPAKRSALIWGALSAGLGVLFRPTYALLVAIGALALALRRRSARDFVDAALFAGIAALPLFLVFAVYALTGHERAISDLLTFASSVYVNLERRTRSDVLLGFWNYVPLVVWLGVVLTMIAVARGQFGAHRRELWTLVLVFAGCVIIRLWESKAWRYQYWPPLAVLSLAAGLGWGWVARNRIVFGVVAILVLGLELGRTGLARYAHWTPMPMIADSPDQEAMAEYLRTHTRPGERIQMWGPETIVLFASGARSATRFIDTNMFFCPDPKNFHHRLLFTDCPNWNKPIQVAFMRELVDTLTAHPPTYIAAHYANGSMMIDTTYCLAPDLPATRPDRPQVSARGDVRAVVGLQAREPVRHGLRLGVVVALMLVGASVDAIDLWRPIDGTSRELYRESDEGGIARNYARGGMRLLYPQIDWRGDGPGYVEMEFPLYPYMIATGYRVFGIHEQIGRVISYALALATLLVFIGLASYLLPPSGAIVASLFFALDPLTVRIANAIQAEPLMLFAYVAAVSAFIRWLDDDRWVSYGLALGMTSLAILAKAPAAHLGFVFVFFTLWRQGWRGFRRLRLWVFAVAALIPPALWYVHARGFWLTYGNSLGASNHQHVAGLATFTHVHYIAGIADLEVAFAWVGAGLLAVVLALALGPRPKYFGYGLLWYAAVFLFYLVIAGTSADPWGTYYHVVSVPPVALLIGGAAAVAAERLGTASTVERPALVVAIMVIAVAIVQVAHPGAALLPIACAGVATVGVLRWRRSAAAAGTAGLVVLTAFALILAARQDIRDVHPHRYTAWYATARQFAPLIPPGVTIAVSGNYCVSPSESAYNSPWYLYWTDHKGFTPCIQDHTMPVIQSLIARGAQYFIAERTALSVERGFEGEMRRTFPVLSETPVAVLFQLSPLRTTGVLDSASSGGSGRYR